VDALTKVLLSCGHATSEWPQLYRRYLDFSTTYQLLGTCVNVTIFHIQDGLLYHMGHIYVPTRERPKLIWEAHYSQMGWNFGVDKIVVVLHKKNYWQKL
jgi:hypothetical protein